MYNVSFLVGCQYFFVKSKFSYIPCNHEVHEIDSQSSTHLLLLFLVIPSPQSPIPCESSHFETN